LTTRTLVIHPFIKNDKSGRNPAKQLEEACGLSAAIKLDIIFSQSVALKTIKPSTYLGKGKVEEISELVGIDEIELVIMDCPLSPIQQRNLEKEWHCKVIDRAALILEIFGDRANTKEGVLQVELAALEYQKSRLVRSWTHLERQRGGHGITGGPGERQIELDRRMINDRIVNLKKQLEKVKKTRRLHRKSRQKIPYPVIALVGYTNAGKSTLFNRLTGADVYVEDLLFATLDPTMRVVKTSSGRKVILSDTVGFISSLPTELIAAFRATLEEVIEADIICHVRDISSPDSEEQKEDVLNILRNLGIEETLTNNLIEVANKTDLLEDDISAHIHRDTIKISAINGDGCDILLKEIDLYLNKLSKEVEIELEADNGKLLSWLYEHGDNLKIQNIGDKVFVQILLSNKNIARFEAMRGQ
jgi:GTP-binding protein HflX